MGIAETQLVTWSAQGKIGQSRDTYSSIKGNLLDKSAPYPVANCEVFLHGSYGNDTNVFAESDVDIVLKHKGAFYRDVSRLSGPAIAAYDRSFLDAGYKYEDFKKDAFAWITRLYNGVTLGKKAVFIKGNSNRRDADVLVVQEFRRYYEFESLLKQRYEDGICFLTSGGTRIENFPEQHSENCTAKHQNTYGWFKPMVRIFKNMRNRMIEQGLLAKGIAPSYFLEGMLYNVPDDKFGKSYADTWVECFNWLVTARQDQLVCANRLHWLLRDNEPTSWATSDFSIFMRAAKAYWERSGS
jgi:hypothetical protein